jgi:hypothetical protein
LDPDLLRQWLPIGVSLLSLLLASIALGWNVHRDVILKARVRVSFAVVRVMSVSQAVGQGKQYLRISTTNHGPGPVKIDIISGQNTQLWRMLLRRPQFFVILVDHTNPLNPRLPQRLEVGDTHTLLLPYDQNCFLSGDATHIGVADSFGRNHYAPRGHIRDARTQFQNDFGRRP